MYQEKVTLMHCLLLIFKYSSYLVFISPHFRRIVLYHIML